MKFNIPVRLTGPINSRTLMNQFLTPGSSGMRIQQPYTTQSLLQRYGTQNAVGYNSMYGSGYDNGMGYGSQMNFTGGNPLGMNGMGMAATAAVAAAALMQENQQQYGQYDGYPYNGGGQQYNNTNQQPYGNQYNNANQQSYGNTSGQNTGQQTAPQGCYSTRSLQQNNAQSYSTQTQYGNQNSTQSYNTQTQYGNQNGNQPYSSQTQYSNPPQQNSTPPAQPRQNTPPQNVPQPVQQNTAPVNTAPALPSGGNELKRGQKISLGTDVRRINVGIRWKVNNPACEVDASAFMLAANDKVPSEDWLVFYSQTQSPDGSTRYNGYDAGGSDITIDLSKVRQDIEKISLSVTIYESFARHQNFSMVSEVNAAIINPDNGKVIASIDLTNCSSVVTALVVGEIYRHKGEWKFNAVGSGVTRDLAGFCGMYGVELI